MSRKRYPKRLLPCAMCGTIRQARMTGQPYICTDCSIGTGPGEWRTVHGIQRFFPTTITVTMPKLRDVTPHPCGTEAAYRRHHRKGEPVCEPCAEANNAAKRQRRKKAA